VAAGRSRGSRRAFVVVLDGCGAGALPDAEDYGDVGADTLTHVAAATGGLRLPALGALGLGSIVALRGVPPAAEPVLHGRLAPLGPGKDSATGHWELMGAVLPGPLPTYPHGFPREVVERLEAATGHAFVGNRPDDGERVIRELGAEHLETGRIILYTSQDSVLQLAAHADRVGPDRLYELCERVREVMTGPHAVGRVIARPFAGPPGAFVRLDGRRDFAVPPPGRTYLDELADAGVPAHGVGKAASLFGGRGIAVAHAGSTNARALAVTSELVDELEHGLAFVNLVETDQVHGHRRDAEGFARALEEIDHAVAGWRRRLGRDDLLVLCADHGCDPGHRGTDHTREHVPLLAVFPGHGGRRHDGHHGDVGASVLRWLTGRDADLPGRSFV
jgi:phosphopentomutase